jgi:Na+/H+ antiporter NhaD/arsenite permease-like protein
MMDRRRRHYFALLVPLAILLLWNVTPVPGMVQSGSEITLTLQGRVINTQGNPVDDAEITVLLDEVAFQLVVAGEELDVAHTEQNGAYSVDVRISTNDLTSLPIQLVISKPGFRSQTVDLDPDMIVGSDDFFSARVPTVELTRIYNPAFFLSSAIFVIVFGLISFNVLHETVAAFFGAAAMLGVSYLLGNSNPDFWILGFEKAVGYIDFDVIFLIMTLMIVVSIIGNTGLFQWLAMRFYRIARGNAWLLAILLMSATAILSAFLNNVTIMLLMAPITIEIALILEINPGALIIPAAMASNIGGIATLIGDPPNTVIGSFADIGFNQFLIHMGPMAIISMVALFFVVYIFYRREYASARTEPSEVLLEHIESVAVISEPSTLRRALLVSSLMIVLFFTGESFQMPPSVVGFIGATLLLIWVRPDVDEMLNEVDWTTLMFFISLFIVVGGVQEVGLIQLMTNGIAELAGQSLTAASQSMIWLSAGASAIINNIPFTTAVLPIAAFLTKIIPAASNNVLYWSLSLGANLGGNATYVGSAPNVVAVGVMDRAGYHVSFLDWLKIGIPVSIITILFPAIWIAIRYNLLGN